MLLVCGTVRLWVFCLVEVVRWSDSCCWCVGLFVCLWVFRLVELVRWSDSCCWCV